jgi:hypothetical protein
MDPKEYYSQEYDLISFLICGLDDETLNQEFIDWESNTHFKSYESLNPKNVNYAGGIEKFDLDKIFNIKQRAKINDFFKVENPRKVDQHLLKCQISFNKIKGYVPKKKIYSYSYPIISEGIDHEVYGIVLENTSFEVDNSELFLKVYKKESETWELVHQLLIAFG